MRMIDAEALQKWLDDYINEYNHGDWYGSAFNADWVDSVIENAPTVTVPQWISVKDRMPEADGTYLVVKDTVYCGKVISTCRFTQDISYYSGFDYIDKNNPGWYVYVSEGGYYVLNNVTHWMNLPEPPKEEENAD